MDDTPPPRPTRRRTARFLARGAVLLVLALAVAGLVRAGAGTVGDVLADVRDAQTTVAGRKPPEDVATRDRLSGVQALLDARALAVRDGNAEAFLDTVGAEGRAQSGGEAGKTLRTEPDDAFLVAQRELTARLAVLPISQWSYTLEGTSPVPAARRAQIGSDAWVALVHLTYRLGPDTPAVTRTQRLTVTERPVGWRIVADTDGETDRDLWDLTDVVVEKGDRSLVIAAQAQRSHLATYVRTADSAARTVDDYLGTDWPRRVVVLAPASAAQMAQLLGWGDAARLDQIAAVTTGTGGDESDDRILLNPTAFSAFGLLGRRVVVTHETTHVAARAQQKVTPPLWLEEAYADWVAYQDSGLGPRSIAEDALRQVDRGRIPADLPGADAFDAAKGGDIGVAYGQGWLAMQLIQDRHGPAAVTRFYETAAGITTAAKDATAPLTADQALDEAFAQLGVTRAEFVAQWQDYLRSLAE